MNPLEESWPFGSLAGLEDEIFDAFIKIARALPWCVLQREYEARLLHRSGPQPVTQSGEPELFFERSPSRKRSLEDIPQPDSPTSVE